MNMVRSEPDGKRSFIFHKIQTPITATADKLNEPDKPLGLLDCSTRSRCGFRGANAAAHLLAVGLPVPEKPNQATSSNTGELVVRLSQHEFWVLSNLATADQGFILLDEQALPASHCYPLYCQNSHAWFAIIGKPLAKLLAKVCGVDLRNETFPVGAVVQTSVVRLNAMVIHHEINSQSVFFVLSDSAAAEYLWDALLDTMQEFGGCALDSNE